MNVPFVTLILLPLADLILLLWIGRHTSLAFVLSLVITGVVAGSLLLRGAKRRSLRVLQSELASGNAPTTALLKVLSVIAAGALFIFPGVLTDLAAVVLLVPITRRLVGLWMARRFVVSRERRGSNDLDDGGREAAGRDRVIDVRAIDPPSEAGSNRDDVSAD